MQTNAKGIAHPGPWQAWVKDPAGNILGRAIGPCLMCDVTIATYQARARRTRTRPNVRRPQSCGSTTALPNWSARARARGGQRSGARRGLPRGARRGGRPHRCHAGLRRDAALRRPPRRVLDARTDDLGGRMPRCLPTPCCCTSTAASSRPCSLVARAAVEDGGILAVTLKEGDGSGWTTAKARQAAALHLLARARGLRDLLTRTGWTVVSLAHVAGSGRPVALSAGPGRRAVERGPVACP